MEDAAMPSPPAAAPAANDRREEAALALVDAPAMAQRSFESWAAFDRYVEEYARGTFQLFRKRTSTSVKLRNRRLMERVDGTDHPKKPRSSPPSSPEPPRYASPSARLIPEHYGNYSMTLVCTHSGAFVSRGTGKRTRQEVRGTRCDAQINACLKLADAARDVYEVHVTRALLTHNHRLDRETFGQYSRTRLSLSDALLDCVELMRRAGVKPRDIRAYIVERSSCAPTLKDVQNLLTRLKHQDESRRRGDPSSALQPDRLADEQRNDQSPPAPAEPTAAAASTPPAAAVVDPMAQFQMADSMGRRVARLLADMPAERFTDALRVIELAEAIVLDRQRADSKEP